MKKAITITLCLIIAALAVCPAFAEDSADRGKILGHDYVRTSSNSWLISLAVPFSAAASDIYAAEALADNLFDAFFREKHNGASPLELTDPGFHVDIFIPIPHQPREYDGIVCMY